MEHMTTNSSLLPVRIDHQIDEQFTSHPFIEANTLIATVDEIRHQHLIPVFVKDNEPLITQGDFIGATLDAMSDVFRKNVFCHLRYGYHILLKAVLLKPKISRLISFRIGKNTLYYERIIFAIEVHSIQATIGSNNLSQIVEGVKTYNLDNLYNRKGAHKHLKVSIGLQNKVFTNMCIWKNDYMSDL